MNYHKLLSLLGSIAVGLSAISCGGSGSSDNSTKPQETADVKLASQTILITPGATKQVLGQTTASITLAGVRSDVKPGSVIVSGEGNGALRKVISVSTESGNTVAQTQNATFAEAFERLHVDAHPAFNEKTVGQIRSSVPGVTVKWLNSSESTSRGVSGEFEVDLNHVSISKTNDISITGKPHFKLDSGFLVDVKNFQLNKLAATATCTLSGDVTVESKSSGALSGKVDWFPTDIPIGPPTIVWVDFVPLVFAPVLSIESEISGQSSSKVTHHETLGMTVSGGITYTPATGVTTDKDISFTREGMDDDVEGSFQFKVVPIKAKLAYKLYDVAGPYMALEAEGSAEGTHEVQNGVEGILAKVDVGFGGEIGLEAGFDIKGFGAAGSVFVPFTIDEANVFKKFFPFTGSASLSVGDNGPAPDDVFAVSLDGVSLGQTDKGGTGAFRVSDLSVGKHALTITCLDDGASGDDIGTLGIALADGLTFEDGSTSLSDGLALNETKSYTINVPANLISRPNASRTIKLPRSRFTVEHPHQ